MEVPYGKKDITFSFHSSYNCELLAPVSMQGLEPASEIKRALEHPINSQRLKSFINVKKVAIAVSDLTRNVPYKVLLPLILEELEQAGIKRENIKILVGGGLHRPLREDEYNKILETEKRDNLQFISHDATSQDELVHLGVTSRGTPVFVNRHYVEADLKIVTGIIEPHQFVGFTAGAKGVAVGLAGEQTIRANHSMMSKPCAEMAEIENNPVRSDLEEISGMAGIDFLVNLVLNPEKQVVKAVTGNYFEAHREGVKTALEAQKAVVNKKADIVIISPGGYPKDIDVYQAQKALTTASKVIKSEKSTVILTAECPEGFGNELFEKTLAENNNPAEVIHNFERQEFEMGVHKAYLWAKAIIRARTILVSDKITEEQACTLKVGKYSTLKEAMDNVLMDYSNPHIAVIPYGNSTIPVFDRM